MSTIPELLDICRDAEHAYKVRVAQINDEAAAAANDVYAKYRSELSQLDRAWDEAKLAHLDAVIQRLFLKTGRIGKRVENLTNQWKLVNGKEPI